MSGIFPSIGAPVVARPDSRDDKRPATEATKAAAEADAQAWANDYVRTGDLTVAAARELRARVQQFASARTERFTEQQITDILTRVLEKVPPGPGRGPISDEVRTAAATPLPDPAGAAHHDAGTPNPNAEGVHTGAPDHGGQDAFVPDSRTPNPNAQPNPSVLAARVPPPAVVPPPPPVLAATVPRPPLKTPPPPPVSPLPAPAPDRTLVATVLPGKTPLPMPQGTPVSAGTPVVLPGDVPGEAPVPGVRVVHLGDPVRGMDAEQQQATTVLCREMEVKLGMLTSTDRATTSAPVMTQANLAETSGVLLRDSWKLRAGGRSGKSSSREGVSEDSRSLHLGYVAGVHRDRSRQPA